MRMLRTTTTLLLVLALALTVAACSSDDQGTTSKSGSKSAGDSRPAGGVEADLKIIMTKVGGKLTTNPIPAGLACNRALPATCRGNVTCPADEGADPVSESVCQFIAGTGRDALTAKPDDDEVCTEIYGGDEIATVTGTIDGEPIDAKFTRTNGCEIGRFNAAAPLWSGVAAGGIKQLPSGTPPPPVDATPPSNTEPDIISDPPEAFQ